MKTLSSMSGLVLRAPRYWQCQVGPDNEQDLQVFPMLNIGNFSSVRSGVYVLN